MNAKELLALTLALNASTGDYADFSIFLEDAEFEFDEEVNDCEMTMYLFMLSGDEELHKEFIELYDKLDEKKQKFIYKKFLSVTEERDKKQKNNTLSKTLKPNKE